MIIASDTRSIAPETSRTANLQPDEAQLPRQRVLRAVRFGLEMPNVRKVSVVGTFNNWDPEATPLRCVGGTRWYVYVPVEVGRHEYRFLVDGKSIDDPKARVYVPNPQGGRNAVLEVKSNRARS